MILSKRQITKALIGLHGRAGSYAPLLFTNPKVRFSCVAAHNELSLVVGVGLRGGGGGEGGEIIAIFCLFVCLVRCFMSQSIAMVMLRWSVHLTTLFPGRASD